MGPRVVIVVDNRSNAARIVDYGLRLYEFRRTQVSPRRRRGGGRVRLGWRGVGAPRADVAARGAAAAAPRRVRGRRPHSISAKTKTVCADSWTAGVALKFQGGKRERDHRNGRRRYASCVIIEVMVRGAAVNGAGRAARVGGAAAGLLLPAAGLTGAAPRLRVRIAAGISLVCLAVACYGFLLALWPSWPPHTFRRPAPCCEQLSPVRAVYRRGLGSPRIRPTST